MLNVRRPGILLVACIVSSIMLLFILAGAEYSLTNAGQHISSLIDNDNAASALGYMLGFAINAVGIIPQLVLFALALILEWCGYGTKVRGLTLAAGIIYCVALVVRISAFIQVGISIVLAFTGFAAQIKAFNIASAEAAEEQKRENDLNDIQIQKLIIRYAQGQSNAAQVANAGGAKAREEESEEDRLGRLSVQAQRWKQSKTEQNDAD